jgi:hypothetical protein
VIIKTKTLLYTLDVERFELEELREWAQDKVRSAGRRAQLTPSETRAQEFIEIATRMLEK